MEESSGDVVDGSQKPLDKMISLLTSALPEVRKYAARYIGDEFAAFEEGTFKSTSDPEIKAAVDRLLDLIASTEWIVRSSAANVFYYAFAARIKRLTSGLARESPFPSHSNLLTLDGISAEKVLDQSREPKYRSSSQSDELVEGRSVRAQLRRLGERINAESLSLVHSGAGEFLGSAIESAVAEDDVAALGATDPSPKRRRVSPHDQLPSYSPLHRSWAELQTRLSSDEWEVRHGAALGMRASLRGIRAICARLQSSFIPPLVARDIAANTMDIIVRSLCALAQERFADFSEASTISPVREMCSQVLTIGASCLAHVRAESRGHIPALVSTLLCLVDSDADWDVRHAGLVALKYLSLSLFHEPLPQASDEPKSNAAQDMLLRQLIAAAEKAIRFDLDDGVKCAALALLQSIYLTCGSNVRGDAPEIVWDLLLNSDTLAPCIPEGLRLLQLLARSIPLTQLRPLLPYLGHYSLQVKKIAYDTAGAIGAKVDLASAKDEFVAQFARLSFAVLQGLCVEATSGCLEHVVKAWKNIVASCAQSGVGYGILSQLVSPHMIEKQWYTLGCASQTQSLPSSAVSIATVEHMKGNDEFSVFSGIDFFERYLKATRARNILPSGTSAGFHALAQGLGGAIQGMMQYESSCGTDIRNALRNSTMASRRTDSRADTDILVSHTIIQKLVTADDTFRIFALCALFYAMAQYPTPSEYRSKVSALLSNITSATYNKYRLALGNQDKDLQKPVVAVVMSASACIAWYGPGAVPAELNPCIKGILAVFHLGGAQPPWLLCVARRALWTIVTASKNTNRIKLTRALAESVLTQFEKGDSLAHVASSIVRGIAELEGRKTFDFFPSLFEKVQATFRGDCANECQIFRCLRLVSSILEGAKLDELPLDELRALVPFLINLLSSSG